MNCCVANGVCGRPARSDLEQVGHDDSVGCYALERFCESLSLKLCEAFGLARELLFVHLAKMLLRAPTG